MPLRYKTTTLPRVHKTDKWEFHFYPEDGVFKVWERTIFLGEISTKRRPKYCFYTRDFVRNPEILDVLIEYLQAYRQEIR